MSLQRQNSVKDASTKKAPATSSSASSSVTVCVRIRPENPAERKAGLSVAFVASDTGDSAEELDETGHISKSWPYDHVFGPESSNRYIFDVAAAGLIESALEGYNTVMFMYGQTSSGKTFTLFGGGGVPGVVDHSIEMVYNSIMNSTDTEYVVKIIFIELYNEEIKDLLAAEHNENLKIIEDPILGPSIMNIQELNFISIADTRRILDEGDQRRHFGVTNMNAHSSRSHVLFRLNIEARKVYGGQPAKPLRQSWGKDKPTCFSTLNLVDLAGSERANKAGTSGQSLKEGSYINKSLLTLGTVIAHLSDESKSRAHIPYRNSKLTRLLAAALGGNAKTSMVACISPARGNAHESLSTLRFASRAKRVVNIVRKNLFDDARSLAEMLAKQKSEMDALREELERSKLSGFIEGPMKEKALMATRKLRNLRFIVMNSVPLIKALGQEGKHAIANAVRNSVRAAIQGSREIGEVLDEHRGIILNHCSSNATLMKTVAVIDHLNDMSSINIDCEDDDNSVGSGSTMGLAIDLGDVVGELVDEENEVERERLMMRYEDLGSRACTKIISLINENEEQARIIAEYKRKNSELTAQLNSSLAEVEGLEFAERSLKETVEEIKRQMAEAHSEHMEKNANMQKQIDELETLTEQREKSVLNFQQAASSKDFELLHMQTVCDQLTKELEKKDQEMKIFQAEAVKTRALHRQQVEQLRGNMHSMLTQGGETTKVLELQNSFLHRDCELLRDELDSARSTKSQLSHEVVQLRGDVQRYVAEFQQLSTDASRARAEASASSEQVTSLKSRVARLTNRVNNLEEENTNIKRQLGEANKELVSAAEIRTNEVKALKTASNSTINELREALAIANNDLQCTQELLKSKEAEAQRYVSMLMSDENRLESKLKAEEKRSETLLNELSAERHRCNDIYEKFAVESRSQKSRIQMLEQWLSSVNSFIGRHIKMGTDRDDDLLEDVAADGSVVDINTDDIANANSDFLTWGDATSDTPRRGSLADATSSPVSNRRSLSFYLDDNPKNPSVRRGRTDQYDEPSLEQDCRDSDITENIKLPHVSSLRKLFPLPRHLSSDADGIADAVSAGSSPQNKIDTSDKNGQLRMNAIYEKYLNTPSLPFLRVKFGLKALRTCWVHAINEDSLLKNYVTAVADENYSSSSNNARAMEKVNKQSKFFQARISELESERADLIASYSETKTCLESFQEEMRGLAQKYSDAVVSLESISGANEILKAQNAVLKSRHEHIQFDCERLKVEKSNLSIEVKRLNLQINDISISYDLMESKLEQLKQRLSVTTVQRDELVRQFLGGQRFEDDEFGTETLATANGDQRSSYDSNDDSDLENFITTTGSVVPLSKGRKSSIRSDNSDKFMSWV